MKAGWTRRHARLTLRDLVRGLFRDGQFQPQLESVFDRFLVTAAIPIGALPPGDSVVRATVAAQDQAGGRVVRPIRKVAR